MKELTEKLDWEGLAKAAQEGNLKWHVTEWKEFIENIRIDERKKIREKIGLLRQWLNEKPEGRLVTDEDIATWLLK